LHKKLLLPFIVLREGGARRENEEEKRHVWILILITQHVLIYISNICRSELPSNIIKRLDSLSLVSHIAYLRVEVAHT
jgi:hypothetical protein